MELLSRTALKRNGDLIIVGALMLLAVVILAISFPMVQRKQVAPSPVRLTQEQQQRADSWKRVLNEYFQNSYRPPSTSVMQDLATLQKRLGQQYRLDKDQVQRIRWLHEQLGAKVVAAEARQDEGRTNYPPYPVLRLTGNDDTQKAAIELSPDGRSITSILAPVLTIDVSDK